MRDTPSVETARKIASDSELRRIAAAGVGFIVDPFNRRWHVATCPRVLGMTVGQPKWFAISTPLLEAFLRRRLTQYPTSKPLLACTTCGDKTVGTVPLTLPRMRTVADPQPRSPYLARTDSGFEVWADEYVRNDSVAGSAAGRLRSLIVGRVRGLPSQGGRVLHAGYAGWRWRGTDVENLLFNNMDQTLALFSAPGGAGIRFEELGCAVPPPPDGTSWPSFYSYRMSQPSEPFAAVEPGRLICRVPEAIVPEGPARLAARIWLAVRRARPLPGPGVLAEDGEFLLRIAVHQMEPGRCVKALVDGAAAAMQCDAPGRVGEAITRLSRLMHADPAEMVALATEPGAPLGVRSRQGPASKESLFTLDGPDNVRVTPDDDRCIAAEVLTAGNDGPARLTVEVYSATRRSSA
jgi:hypothetical protein